ncbi:hypothetical protein GTP46_09500 [Duganella sp. FT135W]|uniref:PIN domain-containing protein n=1 Tax=Duganella flavida TaxID=2692175 RepID=A0A6L8K5U1_9BURK|nr:hypothetical protein [Duganella flavida]MYM22879.1 hypothetical protein [Duganella flavida]
MSGALIDTDILLKTASYQLLKQLLLTAPFGIESPAMIGAAQFVVTGKLKRKLKGDLEVAAKAHFLEAIQSIAAVEPTPSELQLAAKLESAALTLGVDLDIGESQLCALMYTRGIGLMMTGDKRAIKAISTLNHEDPCAYVHGKVACLEQLILWMIDHAGIGAVQAPVCAVPAVDTSLTMALGCNSGGSSEPSCREGLASYINNIKASAPDVLVPYPG